MKHKKEKSEKQRTKNKPKHKKHQSRSRKKRESKRSKKLKKKLERLAMASGFQGVFKSLQSSSGSISRADEDDDIVVVFDKNADKKYLRETGNNSKETKFCLSKQFDVNLKDIPLPPENWVSNGKNCNSLRVEDIPLPPSSSTYERLQNNKETDKNCEAKQLENLINNFRIWEFTELGKQICSRGNSPNDQYKRNCFTLMSYNVLAQQLLEDHRELYRRNDSNALKWNWRSATLLKEIQDGNADILCLQEVQYTHWKPFYSQLEDFGYRGIYKRRSDQHPDGCAIFYKADKFKVVDKTTVEYFQYMYRGCSILDRYNVAVIARLALRNCVGCENEIVVATTHLLYNPKRHDVKLAQTQVLLAELDRMSYIGADKVCGKTKYLPTIVTGDFNLQPHTAVYKLIVDGSLRYSDLAARSLSDPYYGQPLQDALLPFDLQISNTCQHLGLMLHRLKQQNGCKPSGKVDTLRFSKLFNSDYYKSLQKYAEIQSEIPLLYEEDLFGKVEKGYLHHNLNFQSVYKHQCQSSSTSEELQYEATTHQNDWVTVDYIFYSGTRDEPNQQVKEGALKLLSCCKLPTRAQCNELKAIPNAVCGSDHFSLLASFCLTVK